MRHLTLLVILPFLFACAGGSGNPNVSAKPDLFTGKSWNLAVLDLEYQPVEPGQNGTVNFQSAGPDAGRDIAALLASELSRLENVTLIERGRMADLVEEQKLQLSGMIDSQSAVEVGKMIGADAVLIGSVSDYLAWSALAIPGSTVSFSIRIIEVESGKVVGSASVTEALHLVTAFENAQKLAQQVVNGLASSR